MKVPFFMAVFGPFFKAQYADDITIEMLNKRDDGAKMVYPRYPSCRRYYYLGTQDPRSQRRIYAAPKVGTSKNQKTTKKFKLHLMYRIHDQMHIHKGMGILH